MTTQKIIKLKIHRNEVGTTIPFDTMYLVHKEAQELIPKIFQYALVLPVDERMTDVLVQHVKPTYVKTTEGPLHEHMRKDQIVSNDNKTWWVNFIESHDLHNRVSVIPILVRKARKKLSPRYLSAQRWWRSYGTSDALLQRQVLAGKVKPPIPETTYLITPLPAPHNKIQPICSVCSRAMNNLAGQCIPGMPICYKALDLNRILSTDEGEDEDARVQ